MSKTPAQRLRKHGERAAVAPSEQHSGQRPPARQGAGAPAGQPMRPAQPGEGNPKLIIIAALGATLFMFWYFHLLTLTQMTQLSNGLAMPDSLIGGFSGGYLQQLRDVLNSDALGQLSYVHKTAGTIFVVVFGLTFLLVFGTWAKSRAVRWAGFAGVLLFAVVSISGQIAIDGALGSHTFSAGLATLASVLVVLGWVLLILLALGGGAVALLSWRQKKAVQPADA
ncbi:hypothetical protein [Sinomonas humi]|uniref:Uncharacterized protein n=1 Tax=Sinomonas humi TaxID=1338436 RepID=A0A0B2APT9_9MICC|nr:hypothetical protein [Sinomonas humi]KHL03868.1 hypothetical protein LK10_08195 [Sinomonas humi]